MSEDGDSLNCPVCSASFRRSEHLRRHLACRRFSIMFLSVMVWKETLFLSCWAGFQQASTDIEIFNRLVVKAIQMPSLPFRIQASVSQTKLVQNIISTLR